MLDKPTFLYERAMGQKIYFKQLVYGKLALDNKKKNKRRRLKKTIATGLWNIMEKKNEISGVGGADPHLA